MAFDIGLNFRQTDTYVTDPVDTTYVLATDTYPTTRGGATFGWVSSSVAGRNRSLSVDPRIAGIHFGFNDTAQRKFRVDLPASGSVDVYCGIGDAGGANSGYLEAFDDTVSLDVLVAKKAVSTGTFYDATDTGYSSANWPASNASTTLSYSTTTALFAITPGDDTGSNYAISHLRVVQGSSASTYTISPTGSITFSGASDVVKTKVINSTGNVTFSGNSDLIKTKIIAPSGAVNLSGNGNIVKGRIYSPSGGLSFSGSTPSTKSKVIAPTGFLELSGTASLSGANSYMITPTGKASFLGSATLIKTHVQLPTGLISFSGTAPLSSNTVIVTVNTRLALTGVGQ